MSYNQQDVGRTIRKFRKLKDLSQKQLADAIPVTQALISKIEKGATASTTDTLTKIAAALGCTVSELLGEGNSEQTSFPRQLDGVRIVDESSVLYVPLISTHYAACAGNGNCYEDLQLEFDGTCRVDSAELSAFYSADGLVAIRIDGESMSGRNIHDGDTAICDKSPDWITGHIYLVCLDGRLMIKAVVSRGAGKLPVLKSANPAYSDVPISEDSSFCVLGRVVGIVPKMFKPEPIM